MNTHHYHLLHEIHHPISVKINSLRGWKSPHSLNTWNHTSNHTNTEQSQPPPLNDDILRHLSLPSSITSQHELYVTAYISTCNQPIGINTQTSIHEFSDIHHITFNEWLTFDMQYSEINETSRLNIIVWYIDIQIDSHHTHMHQKHQDRSSSGAKDDHQNGEDTIKPVIIGSTSMPFINQRHLLKTGRRKLMLHPHVLPDHIHSHHENTTMHNKRRYYRNKNNNVKSTSKSKVSYTVIEQLDKISRRYDTKPLPAIQWLDKLVLQYIERIQHTTHTYQRYINTPSQRGSSGSSDGIPLLQSDLEYESLFQWTLHDDLHLTIETPAFKYPIIYIEQLIPQTHTYHHIYHIATNNVNPNTAHTPTHLSVSHNYIVMRKYSETEAAGNDISLSKQLSVSAHRVEYNSLFPVFDPEQFRDNPIELMYHKLARSNTALTAAQSQYSAAELKPNKDERNAIMYVLSLPYKRLNIEHKELLWRFRYSLIDDKRALVKFLRCINWSDASETTTALTLLHRWKSPIDISDALELLSSFFTNQEVRIYAVKQLEVADNNELYIYLLQLVQALRYENDIDEKHTTVLGNFLIQRCTTDLTLASYFYWYIQMECNDSNIQTASTQRTATATAAPSTNSNTNGAGAASSSSSPTQQSASSSNVATIHTRYVAVQDQFIGALKSTESGLSIESMLRNESQLVSQLTSLFEACIAHGGKVEQRIARLRHLLTSKGSKHHELGDLGSTVAMPIQPTVMVTGVVASDTSMFKSALAPMLLCFRMANTPSHTNTAGGDGDPVNSLVSPKSLGSPTSKHRSTNSLAQQSSITSSTHSSTFLPYQTAIQPSPSSPTAKQLKAAVSSTTSSGTDQGGTYKVIFKVGDDLRQDQLVVNMITLFDTLLKLVNLNLHLTPYRVVAVSSTAGFVEYVPQSCTLSYILAEYKNDIKAYLKHHNPTQRDMQVAMNRFLRSCAGYCVITYLLGVGDRHGDNVLVTSDGRLFHIDFAYLFGRDPKPFPPPMKFSKEMVEAMGGADSNRYREFRQYCVSCYNQLRQHASLIINLLSLMADANIADLSGPQSETILTKLQERFRLDLNDDDAGIYILTLIDQSVNALFAQVMESLHSWRTYWR